MNATDELRRMLDERGVEWRGGLPTETMVEADGLDLLYVALPDGRVRAFIRNYITPEQAVEATLGRGACRVEKAMSGAYEQWSCSECGCSLPIGSYDLTAADAGGAPEVVKRYKFTVNYCPNCGAKVVE